MIDKVEFVDALKWLLVRGGANRGMVCEAAFFCPGRAWVEYVYTHKRKPSSNTLLLANPDRQAGLIVVFSVFALLSVYSLGA